MRVVREKRIRLFVAAVIVQRDERAEPNAFLGLYSRRSHPLESLSFQFCQLASRRDQLAVVTPQALVAAALCYIGVAVDVARLSRVEAPHAARLVDVLCRL